MAKDVTKKTFKASVIKLMMEEECSFREPDIQYIGCTEWENAGKYESKCYIFKHNDSYWCAYNSRSGSYYSEYWYESEEWDNSKDIEVFPITKTRAMLRLVKESKLADAIDELSSYILDDKLIAANLVPLYEVLNVAPDYCDEGIEEDDSDDTDETVNAAPDDL